MWIAVLTITVAAALIGVAILYLATGQIRRNLRK